MCATMWRHLVNATEVIVGLPESNGSLPLAGWLKVTYRLTATLGSAFIHIYKYCKLVNKPSVNSQQDDITAAEFLSATVKIQ